MVCADVHVILNLNYNIDNADVHVDIKYDDNVNIINEGRFSPHMGFCFFAI